MRVTLDFPTSFSTNAPDLNRSASWLVVWHFELIDSCIRRKKVVVTPCHHASLGLSEKTTR